MISKRKIFLLTAIVAAMSRVVCFLFFRDSLFCFYHCVPGLDMQTLLRFSEWGEGGSGFAPFLTPHRVLIYLVWKLNGMMHAPGVVIFFHTLAGICGAVMLADIALKLSGSRKAALVSGIVYGVYLPFMFYEYSLLQETFAVNLTVGAFWALLCAVKRRFAFPWTIAAGILPALALMGRPTALFAIAAVWIAVIFYSFKRRYLHKALISLGIVIVLLGGAGIFNTLQGWQTGPFYNVLPYTLQYNASKSVKDGAVNSAPAKTSLITSGFNALKRTPYLLSLTEIPENLNLEFLRYKIKAVRLFPGPEMLLSCTIFAGIIMLLSWKIKRKEYLVFSVILFLAVPLCAREAIGRYRLMLCPGFILISCFGFREFFKLAPLRRAVYGGTGLAGVAVAAFLFTHTSGLRTADFHAWALAAEARYGSGKNETLTEFYKFWEAGNFSDPVAFQTFCRQAFLGRKAELVKMAIAQAEHRGKVDKTLISYFKGLVCVGENDPAGVAEAFKNIDPGKLPEDLRDNFHRIKNDTERIIGNSKEKSS